MAKAPTLPAPAPTTTPPLDLDPTLAAFRDDLFAFLAKIAAAAPHAGAAVASAEPEGQWLLLVTGSAGATVFWRATRDCHIRNVCGCDSLSQWVLGFDGRTRLQLITVPTTGNVELGTVIAWYSNADNGSARTGMNVFIPAGKLLYLSTTANAATPVLVYLV